MTFTKYPCKNFKKGYMPCELCVINKTYIDLQNVECQSCFEPDYSEVKMWEK